jgi:siroheme synthase (precorrin-2 oxidase/ferrochelatase)
MATINIEDMVQIGISTSGRSPIVARIIRIRAEKILRRTLNQITKIQKILCEKQNSTRYRT